MLRKIHFLKRTHGKRKKRKGLATVADEFVTDPKSSLHRAFQLPESNPSLWSLVRVFKGAREPSMRIDWGGDLHASIETLASLVLTQHCRLPWPACCPQKTILTTPCPSITSPPRVFVIVVTPSPTAGKSSLLMSYHLLHFSLSSSFGAWGRLGHRAGDWRLAIPNQILYNPYLNLNTRHPYENIWFVWIVGMVDHGPSTFQKM